MSMATSDEMPAVRKFLTIWQGGFLQKLNKELAAEGLQGLEHFGDAEAPPYGDGGQPVKPVKEPRQLTRGERGGKHKDWYEKWHYNPKPK